MQTKHVNALGIALALLIAGFVVTFNLPASGEKRFQEIQAQASQ